MYLLYFAKETYIVNQNKAFAISWDQIEFHHCICLD